MPIALLQSTSALLNTPWHSAAPVPMFRLALMHAASLKVNHPRHGHLICARNENTAVILDGVQIPEVGDEEKDIQILHYGAVDANNRWEAFLPHIVGEPTACTEENELKESLSAVPPPNLEVVGKLSLVMSWPHSCHRPCICSCSSGASRANLHVHG